MLESAASIFLLGLEAEPTSPPAPLLLANVVAWTAKGNPGFWIFRDAEKARASLELLSAGLASGQLEKLWGFTFPWQPWWAFPDLCDAVGAYLDDLLQPADAGEQSIVQEQPNVDVCTTVRS
jgi:hypothetical protein